MAHAETDIDRNTTQKTRYCIFWMPCIAHSEPQLVKDWAEDTFETFTPGLLYGVKSSASTPHSPKARYPVIINLTVTEIDKVDKSNHFSFNVVLRCVEYSRNGLMKFEYTLPEFEDSKFNDVLKDKVYGLIKSHFHVHLYHDAKISLLKGLYCDDTDNKKIKEYDGEVIVYFIKQIGALLTQEGGFILDEARGIRFDIDNVPSGQYEEYRCRLISFMTRCQNLLGQYSFYSALFNSKWNVSCRLDSKSSTEPESSDVQDSNQDNSDLHELAQNIWNTKDGLERIHEKVKSALYLTNMRHHSDIQNEVKEIAKSNNKLTSSIRSLMQHITEILTRSEELSKLSRKLGIWSFFLGVSSLIIGFFSLWQGCSSKKMENKIDRIEETIQTVSKDIRQSQSEQKKEPVAIMTNQNSHNSKSRTNNK